jgi:hypothetical protein
LRFHKQTSSIFRFLATSALILLSQPKNLTIRRRLIAEEHKDQEIRKSDQYITHFRLQLALGRLVFVSSPVEPLAPISQHSRVLGASQKSSPFQRRRYKERY